MPQTPRRNSILFYAVLGLIVAALVLPIAISVVMGLSALLGASGDTPGGKVLVYVAITLGAAWVIDLICLVIILALNSIQSSGFPSDDNVSQ